MDKAEVLDVKRKDGKIVDVRIIINPFTITFVKKGKKIVKASVVRWDKERVTPGDLYVPPYLFGPAIKKARGIFHSLG